MTIKQDASGRRSMELRFDVPGTPEQVWKAIATSQGISSWLFPTDVEEREGGAIAFHIAPGMESAGTVTTFDPPRRFGYEEPDWSPNAPPLATEFIIVGDAFSRLSHALALDNAAAGEVRRAPADTPPLGGIVEHTEHSVDAREIMLRLDTPAPGVLLLGAHKWGGKAHASMSFFLYGAAVPSIVERDQPRWDEWLQQQVPASHE